MTDRNGLPPERRLDDETRARMRAELTAHAAADQDLGQPTHRVRRLLAPGLAAAAVAALAVGGALAFGGEDRSPETDNDIEVAASSSTPASSTAAAADSPCEDSPRALLPSEGGSAAEPGLIDNGDSTSQTYLTAGEADWVLCNDYAATRGGGLTVVEGTAADKRTADTFAVTATDAEDLTTQLLAGGSMTDPAMTDVTEISYDLGSGGKVEAFIDDKSWVMTAYLKHQEQELQEQPSEPIVVTVTLEDGSTETYELS